MTIEEYLAHKSALHNTTYIINQDGGFYLVNGSPVPEKEFEKLHSTPVNLWVNNKVFL